MRIDHVAGTLSDWMNARLKGRLAEEAGMAAIPPPFTADEVREELGVVGIREDLLEAMRALDGQSVQGSPHDLGAHIAACVGAQRCSFGEYVCPVVFWRLGEKLCQILMVHAGERGDNEGAVDTLLRILRERDSKMRQAQAVGTGIGNVLRHIADRVAAAAAQAPLSPPESPGAPPQETQIVADATAPAGNRPCAICGRDECQSHRRWP